MKTTINIKAQCKQLQRTPSGHWRALAFQYACLQIPPSSSPFLLKSLLVLTHGSQTSFLGGWLRTLWLLLLDFWMEGSYIPNQPGSCYLTKDNGELLILLSLPPKYWTIGAHDHKMLGIKPTDWATSPSLVRQPFLSESQPSMTQQFRVVLATTL